MEATLALDEERVKRVGDDRVGGPATSRKLRLIRILMRDLLIGVCIHITLTIFFVFLVRISGYLGSHCVLLLCLCLGKLLALSWAGSH